MGQLVYKIVQAGTWQSAVRNRAFGGDLLDLQHGFIHLSAAGQLAETARLYFADQADLLLVAVNSEHFGADLRWEVSRNDELFPHLYRDLSPDEVCSVVPIKQDAGGNHIFDV